MAPWRKRFFESTRGKLVALLRRRELTVDEMATALGVTDNAVRAQLAALERDQLVEPRGVRRGGGKPSTAYGPTEQFELSLSRAYAALLRHLVHELGDRLSGPELDRLLAAVGRRWAAELPHAPSGPPRERLAHAATLLEQLGAEVEVEQADGALAIRGFGCPLSAAVHEQPHTCVAVEAMLSAVVGAKLKERCDRTGRAPSCRFVLGGPG
ncbi:MAG TPA: ArsR family transcriptional regulator [Gemmatimonadales bacterium]|nr:ArsR family transcriptional regulator [Gemmatimonadales bacterium]